MRLFIKLCLQTLRIKKLGEYMYKIVKKEILNPTVTLMEIEAPFVAKKAEYFV